MDSKSPSIATWGILGLAIILLICPWVLAFPAGAATYNAVVAGLLVGVTAVFALFMPRRNGGQGWINFVLLNLFLGAWVFVSPLLLKIESDVPVWLFMIVGIAVTSLAMLEMIQITSNRSTVTPAF